MKIVLLCEDFDAGHERCRKVLRVLNLLDIPLEKWWLYPKG